MKYAISRTSTYDKKPCEEAFKSSVEQWHTRTCTEEWFNKRFSEREGLWRSKGKNHAITKEGYITRQETNKNVWCVEIKSLKELHRFVEKYGQIVLIPQGYDTAIPYIEIYDDYRE